MNVNRTCQPARIELRKTLAYVPRAAMCIKTTMNFVRDHLELGGRQTVDEKKKTIDEGHNESGTNFEESHL